MTKHKVFVVGASGHAKVIIDIFEKEGKYEVAGLIDLPKNKGNDFFGYKILGSEDDLPELLKIYPECKIFVAIGDGWLRHKVVEKIKAVVPQIEFVSAIHPSAILARGVIIGKGVAIMAGAIINSDCRIGDFSILNTNSSLEHDGIMHPYSSLLPNSTTGGGVEIGSFSVISIGAIVLHGKKVGEHSIIGAGSVLTSNCENNVVMYGVPAKRIRARQIGEKYL